MGTQDILPEQGVANNIDKDLSNLGSDIDSKMEESSPIVPQDVCIFSNNSAITIVWDKDKNDKEYDIEKDGQIVATIRSTIYRDENVRYGETHKYRVRAKNSLGVSEWSNYVEQKISNGFIKSPQNIKLSPNTDSITLLWDKIDNVTGYEIEIDGEDGQVVNEPFFVHDNLNNGETHYYRVRAVNGDMLGHWSKIYFDKTLKNAEDNVDKEQAEKTSQGNVEADNKTIENSEEDLDEELEVNESKSCGEEKASFYSVNNNEISNVNEENSTQSYEPESIGEVITPMNLSSSSTENSISLCWDEVTGATKYEIEMDGTVISTEDSEYTFSNLQAGTSHSFKIRAVNETETSEWSELIQANTLIADLTINGDMTLTEDLICNYLYVNSGILNLNGHKLVILGDAFQKGGTINLLSGKLIINGSYN